LEHLEGATFEIRWKCGNLPGETCFFQLQHCVDGQSWESLGDPVPPENDDEGMTSHAMHLELGEHLCGFFRIIVVEQTED
jgi:hypothetical protein